MNLSMLSDVRKYPLHMRGDYLIRNDNILNGLPLCGKCDGTGNELYSLYKKCEHCNGTGIELTMPMTAIDAIPFWVEHCWDCVCWGFMGFVLGMLGAHLISWWTQ